MDREGEEARKSLIADIHKLNSSDDKKRVERRTTVRAARESLPPVNLAPVLNKISDNDLKKTLRPLLKPLDKQEAKRIQRAAGYENVTDNVAKWDGIVDQRRKADQLSFPLERVDCRLVTTERNYRPSMKTDLEKEVYGLLHGAKLVEEKQETEEEATINRAMSLKEIRAESKRIARDRRWKQRLEKKAALLNKSKSRKYHKILRREKMKMKKQEFEDLKLTDPEAAVAILNDIEKARLRERMDLRHKNSKWLRIQGQRSGHDMMVRDLLKENSDMRKELLEKLQVPGAGAKDDTDDDEKDESLILKEQANAIKTGKFDANNRWVSQLAVPRQEEKPDDSFKCINTYWENLHEEKKQEPETQTKKGEEGKKSSRKEEEKTSIKTNMKAFWDANGENVDQIEAVGKLKNFWKNDMEKNNEENRKELVVSSKKKRKRVEVKTVDEEDTIGNVKIMKRKEKVEEENEEMPSKEEQVEEKSKTKGKLKKNKKENQEISNNTVETLKKLDETKGEEIDESMIDNIFNTLEKKIERTLKSKMERVWNSSPDTSTEFRFASGSKATQSLKIQNKISQVSNSSPDSSTKSGYATGSKATQPPQVRQKTYEVGKNTDRKNIENKSKNADSNPAEDFKEEQPVPSKMNAIIDRKLGTTRPDYNFLKRNIGIESDDSDSDEGFDDVFDNEENVRLFQEEKKAHEEKNQLKDVSTFLPGWGSWGGPGIVPSAEKMKKFKIKAPKAQNKYSKIGNVIYNEKNDVHSNLRKMMVSELPFPFTSVKDFEASIRQPISSTFVPEVVHKKLIAPPVVHKIGQIIYPMNEEALIQEHEEKKKRESSKLEEKLNEKLGYGRHKFRAGGAKEDSNKRNKPKVNQVKKFKRFLSV